MLFKENNWMIHFDNRPMLVEVEATHNDRPLTYMHNDSEGVSCTLTSPHLIYGLRLTTAPSDQQFEIVSMAKSLTKRTKLFCKDVAAGIFVEIV